MKVCSLKIGLRAKHNIESPTQNSLIATRHTYTCLPLLEPEMRGERPWESLHWNVSSLGFTKNPSFQNPRARYRTRLQPHTFVKNATSIKNVLRFVFLFFCFFFQKTRFFSPAARPVAIHMSQDFSRDHNTCHANNDTFFKKLFSAISGQAIDSA